MSWFTDFLTDTARQAAPGIHQGINTDIQRKQRLDEMQKQIPIEVEKQKALIPGEVERQKAMMPGELEKVRAGETSRNDNALRLLMIGKELDRKRVMEVEEAKARRTNGENPFLSFLTSRVETPQNPAVMPVQAGAPGYGAGEEATSGIVPKTRTEPGSNVLMRGLGLDPSEREAVPSVSGTGKVGVTFQRKPNEAKPTAPHYLSKPDGSTWVVDTPGAEPRQIQPAIKTAQPETETYLASVASGARKDPTMTAVQAQASLDKLAASRGETTGERERRRIEARNDNKELIASIAGAVTGAQNRAGYEAKMDRPITPAEVIMYRMPAATTRRELLAQNPKAITESDIDAGTQFSAAKAMLQEYRDISGRLLTATDAAGAIGQHMKLAYGYYTRTDEDAVRLRALQATVPLLVRALGEKGTLATQDVQRALNAVPDFGDTQQSAQAKIVQLEKFISTVEKSIRQLRPGLERQAVPTSSSKNAPSQNNDPLGIRR